MNEMDICWKWRKKLPADDGKIWILNRYEMKINMIILLAMILFKAVIQSKSKIKWNERRRNIMLIISLFFELKLNNKLSWPCAMDEILSIYPNLILHSPSNTQQNHLKRIIQLDGFWMWMPFERKKLWLDI